ncbi:MAG: hypothetical protein EBR82_73395 [Caulobacteraceae bacterium]|nr:hypothetical protein [Caulobacteraceae bacterium]
MLVGRVVAEVVQQTKQAQQGQQGKETQAVTETRKQATVLVVAVARRRQVVMTLQRPLAVQAVQAHQATIQAVR